MKNEIIKKYEWKKSEKEFYLPKSEPSIVQVPMQKFFMIKGKGNPNLDDFSERIGVLYSISYAIRMMPRNGFTPEGYFEYTVYPLEGIWDLTEKGKAEERLNKDELLYTIMIRQPDFVNEDLAQKALESVKKKKPHPLLSEITFEEMEDGICVQMLHNGSYDMEKQSFNMMDEFVRENGFTRKSMHHREIYIKAVKDNDNKIEQEKLKTILRYSIYKS